MLSNKNENKNKLNTIDSKKDPTKNLPFKISLTESEKKDRDSVLLPYTHHLKPDQDNVDTNFGEDNNEQYLEDDEDDDLEI